MSTSLNPSFFNSLTGFQDEGIHRLFPKLRSMGSKVRDEMRTRQTEGP